MPSIGPEIHPKSGGFFSFGFAMFICLIAFWLFRLLNPLELLFRSFVKSLHENVEITWQTNEKIEWNLEKTFAEANDDAIPNPPDKTPFFSFQDQQAAQPEVPLIPSERILPFSSGSTDTAKVLKLSEQEKAIADHDTTPQSFAVRTDTIFADTINESINKAKQFSNGNGIELMDGSEPSRTIALRNHINTNKLNLHTSGRTRAKPRPKLSTEILSGPILKNNLTAPRQGKISLECKMHPYGVYVQKMMKSIDRQWQLLIQSSFIYLQSMTKPQTFVYRFKITEKGLIKDLTIDSHELSESLGAELCRQSIASRAPFGEWTDKMIQEFGNSDQITIIFEYQ